MAYGMIRSGLKRCPVTARIDCVLRTLRARLSFLDAPSALRG